MAKLSISGVVREILSADNTLSADEVIRQARSRGLNAAPAAVRSAVHNIRSELKRRAPAAQGAARETSQPTPTSVEPAPAAAAPAVTPAAAPTAAPASGAINLSAVLANVALVNRILDLCGGADQARQAAEAVRACGGVEPFLEHLDLVANIRSADPRG